MKDNVLLSICIVNWNAGQQLRECVASIAKAKQQVFELADVIIVDNASSDDSLAGMDGLGVNVVLVRNATNQGFAAACNQAAALARGDYFLFLNPDTRLHQDSLGAPLAYLEDSANARVGICGVQMVDPAGCPRQSHFRFPSLTGFFLRALGISGLMGQKEGLRGGRSVGEHLVVDQVIGAFFLVRRSVFEQLLGFDERFFVYYEEVDFALRARSAGFTSVILTAVTCMHVGGGTSEQVKAERLFYSLRSRLLYGLKHFSLSEALALVGLTLGMEFPSRLTHALLTGGQEKAAFTIRGYRMLLAALPSVLRSGVLGRIRNE